MNAARRKTIGEIITKLQDIQSEIESLQYQEQEAYDNMPDSIQDSEKGDAVQAAVDALECAAVSMNEVIRELEESIA